MKLVKNIGWLPVLFLFMFSCSMESNKKAPEASSDSTGVNEKKVFPVRVQKIQEQEIDRTLNYPADLVAYKVIYYTPTTPGRISKIHVEVGSRVHVGQLLVEMDKTQYNQTVTQYENTKTNYERYDTLHQLGSISEQQYDQAKTQYEVAKSNYNYQRQNTALNSPINGIVTAKYYENGEVYNGSPNTPAGKAAILTLMQINPMKAVVSISQSYYTEIKEGMKAEITSDMFPEKVFEGSIYKIYPTIDASTRTFKVELIIKNNAEKLRPGMFGNINLKLGKINAVVVPSIAILKEEGTNIRYVFIRNNNTAKKIVVTIGKRYNDKVQILSDEIHEGEELVVEGQAKLLNGSGIKVVE
jgi:membrane fusion protein, multidrug efflux system